MSLRRDNAAAENLQVKDSAKEEVRKAVPAAKRRKDQVRMLEESVVKDGE